MLKKVSESFSYSVICEQASKGGYVAFVPALPGCHTQGETLEETELNVKEVIALYLKSLATSAGSDSRSRFTGTACAFEAHRWRELKTRRSTLRHAGRMSPLPSWP
jgi:predicted RNase H-like HicB family nuclease